MVSLSDSVSILTLGLATQLPGMCISIKAYLDAQTAIKIAQRRMMQSSLNSERITALENGGGDAKIDKRVQELGLMKSSDGGVTQ